MGLKADLEENVNATFKSAWEVRTGTYVPEPKDVGFANKAVLLEKAVVLYADLRASTLMVDNYKWEFSAEIYKTFLHCAGKIVKNRGATITAYDGDRVMALFIGDNKCDDAARASLEINWAIINIITPAMRKQWSVPNFELNHTVGIDMSDLRAARTGVRIDNDLVWVGKAANHAAKLTEESKFKSWVTKSVYDEMTNSTKIATSGNQLWTNCTWTSMNNAPIYGSNGWWGIN